jgi:ABC-type oligopeptide transport system ATPase subunit
VTTLLRLERISKVYKVGAFGGTDLTAVRDVSFDVRAGEVVSLIGESGSGKTTIGKMILRLTAATGGTITVDGMDVAGYRGRKLKEYYQKVQGVFQDPFSCYNPIFPADRVLGMIKRTYFPRVRDAEWREKVDDSLRSVRLAPEQIRGRYPHQLSGGQLQRLLIARALLLDIRLLVADEVISMLDASTRVDVLDLLAELKAQGLGIVFITHDLSLGNYVSDRTVILRRGMVVEMGPTGKVFGNPLHPYTETLLAAVPLLHKKWAQVDAERAERAERGGRSGARCAYHKIFPDPVKGPPGNGDRPRLAEAEPDHFVACFREGADSAGPAGSGPAGEGVCGR